MADGEWVSAPMGEFKKDPELELIYKDGQPSYFQERVTEIQKVKDGDQPKGVFSWFYFWL